MNKYAFEKNTALYRPLIVHCYLADHITAVRCCRWLSPRMAAASAGINKQGAAAAMESGARYNRGTAGNTVKVKLSVFYDRELCF